MMSEHDYTTYILTDDVQELAEDSDGTQIVYIQDFHDGVAEGVEEWDTDGVAVEKVEYAYELVDTDQVPEKEHAYVSARPNFRKARADGNSGYWSEEDVHRLLKVYLKHVKRYPLLRGKANIHVWNSVITEFDVKKKFTRMQIKSKIARLRKFGQDLISNGEHSYNKWPFWKAVNELLTLEAGDDKYELDTKTNAPWSDQDILLLLRTYRHCVGEMVSNSKNVGRRAIWARISETLKRPRYQVSLKFQMIKAKWRRWKSVGGPVNEPMMSIFNEMNKVMAAEKIALTMKRRRDIKGTVVRGERRADLTETFLRMYQKKLILLKNSGEVKTRRSLYKQISEEMNIELHYVQVKIASAKGHYKKLAKESKPGKRKKYQFEDVLKSISELEKSIWLRFDEGEGEGVLQSSGEDVVQDARHCFKEPAWFRRHRENVEQRHRDKVQLLKKLVSVLEKIAQS